LSAFGNVHQSMPGDGQATPIYGSFTTAVAAIRPTMNALSSAGGRVTATILQARID
jgi:hypothetical protein